MLTKAELKKIADIIDERVTKIVDVKISKAYSQLQEDMIGLFKATNERIDLLDKNLSKRMDNIEDKLDDALDSLKDHNFRIKDHEKRVEKLEDKVYTNTS